MRLVLQAPAVVPDVPSSVRCAGGLVSLRFCSPFVATAHHCLNFDRRFFLRLRRVPLPMALSSSRGLQLKLPSSSGC